MAVVALGVAAACVATRATFLRATPSARAEETTARKPAAASDDGEGEARELHDRVSPHWGLVARVFVFGLNSSKFRSTLRPAHRSTFPPPARSGRPNMGTAVSFPSHGAALHCAVRLPAIVRILTGVLFVAEGLSKLTGDFVRGGFTKDVGAIAARSFPFWKQFLETVVVPRSDVFGWIVALGELAVGVGLVLGLLTRVAAWGGALLMLSIGLGQARPAAGASWDDWITAGLTTKFAFLLLLAARRGRCREDLGARRKAAQGAAREGRLS